MQARDFNPLRDVLLNMAEDVAAMEDGPARAGLEQHVMKATQALSQFATCILRPAQMRNLSSHSIAQTNAHYYARAADRSVSRLASSSGVSSALPEIK